MQPGLLQGWSTLTRKHLAGVGNAERVESRPNSFQAFHFLGIEHLAQVVSLLNANAMLAGDRASHLDAHLQNPSRQRLAALERAGFAPIEKDKRMQVAI